MPLVETKGAASSQGFGQFAQARGPANYIEDVFSTYIYTGNGSTKTITNGIDLSTKGGLVWTKTRSSTGNNLFRDTTRGTNFGLYSNLTNSQINGGSAYSLSLGTSSYSMSSGDGDTNATNITYASWTWAKQKKFFDIQIYTGNGLQNSKTIPHNLGSVPGVVIIKAFNAPDPADANQQWVMYHRSLPSLNFLRLNTTAASQESGQMFRQPPDATNIYVGDDNQVNISGVQYIAYIFAHDAGGFGLTGTENVISCGSFTCDGSGNATIDLGYEPQWILRKASNEITNWELFDNMRGLSVTDNATKLLYPNLSNAEESTSKAKPTATGFIAKGEISKTYIYIAIRRGPMKVPTDATKVFTPIAASNSGDYVVNAGFPPDMVLATLRDFTSGYNHSFFDRLRGNSNYLKSSATDAESGVITSPTQQISDFSTNQNGIFISSGTVFAYSTVLGITYAWHNFRRAPSFMDVVCYTGNGAGANNQTHNLGVMPEMCILRRRDSAVNWQVVHQAAGTAKTLALNLTNSSLVNSTMSANFTSTYFKTADGTCWFEGTNGNTFTYVAYLFATCAGVSKVGSYTGTGATQTISCGFTGGARFVMVKRTDSTGDWFVWDTARGMVSGTDPSFLLNTTGVEVNANSIYTTTGGFQIVSTAAGINASGGTYIFLAIA